VEAHSQGAPFTYGNVGPVLPDVRWDWPRNIDGVLVKSLDFSVRDRKITSQFRFGVFNLFNTPQFAAPSSSAAVTARDQYGQQPQRPANGIEVHILKNDQNSRSV
jgi:hypothetical protein